MVLKNVSNNNVISKALKEAKSFLDLALGLLRKSNPRSLLFKTHFGIHTFFLKEPIDVIILDKNFKVIKTKESLKPNRSFFWNPKYYLVIELPQNTIKKSSTQIHHQLEIIY